MKVDFYKKFKCYNNKRQYKKTILFLLTCIVLFTSSSIYAKASFNTETSSEPSKTTIQLPIYHMHTGNSSGGGCFGQENTGTTTTETNCPGTMVYYASTDTTGCDTCGAGYFGNQSGRGCWTTITKTTSYTYYTINCGKEGKQIGTLSLEKSTEAWTKSLQLKASFTNLEMAVSATPYSWNGGAATTQDTQDITENGTYTVCLNADANANTAAATVAMTIRNIDHTPPSILIQSISPTEWTKDSVKVILEPAIDLQPDGSSGIGTPQEAYSYDAGLSWSAESAHTFEDNGEYQIQIRDKLGNSSTKTVSVHNIDKMGPTIVSFEYNKEPNLRSNMVSVTAEDLQKDGTNGVGLAENPFSWDGGLTWTSQSSFPVWENGTVTLIVRDLFDNRTTQSVRIQNIDKKGPRISYTINPSGWTKDSVFVTLTSEDWQEDGTEGIGMQPEHYSWDGGITWTDKRETRRYENEIFSVQSKDRYDNVSGITVEITNIDCTGPQLTLTAEKRQARQKVQMYVEATDDQSGLAEQPFSWDLGKSWCTENRREVEPSGGCEVWAKDAVGNITKETVELKNDSLLPVNETEKTQEEGEVSEKSIYDNLVIRQKDTKNENPVISEKQIWAKPSIQVKPDKIVKKPFWKDAAFKKTVVIAGSGILACLCLLLIYFYYFSVRIYFYTREDGNCYLGRERICHKENYYTVCIPNVMWERSNSCIYQLRPSRFFAKAHTGEEMVVSLSDENRLTVRISKSMTADF